MQQVGIREGRRQKERVPSGSHPYGRRGHPLLHVIIGLIRLTLDPGLWNLRLGRHHPGIVLIHEQSPVEDHAEGQNEE